MATPITPEARCIRFATFEFALDTGELRNKGSRVKVEGQPLRVLAALVAHPGEMVTRDELKKQLWPDDTSVDFDHSINVAVKRLREALNDSATTPRFIETLPRRGYRFIYPLNPDPAGRLAAPSLPRRPRGRTVLLAASAGSLGALVLALGYLGILSRWIGAGRSAARPTVAVLRFENLTGDAALDYVGNGLQDDLIEELYRLQAIEVRSRTSSSRYGPGQKSVPEIARDLEATVVVESTVQRERDRFRITIRLIDGTADLPRWTHAYTRDRVALSLLPKEIATDLMAALAVPLSRRERATLATRRTVDPEAYDAYSHGRYYAQKWTNEGQWKAIGYLERAIDLDPFFAPAWAVMGNAYETLATTAAGAGLSRKDALALAEPALLRAVTLDPTLRGPHQTLARIKFGRGDWAGAAEEFQRAREMDPKWLGPETYLLFTGRFDEALAAAREAARDDPDSYAKQLLQGYICFWAGWYDESIEYLQKTVQLDTTNHLAHFELAWNYVKKGMPDKAAAECDTATRLRRQKEPGEIVVQCGWVYAATGRRAQALEIAGRLSTSDSRDSADEGSRRNEDGFRQLAKIYDALGDRERALGYVRQIRDTGLPLRIDRMFSDALRADPQFKAMVDAQRGFPPPTGALAENRAHVGARAAATGSR